MPTDFSKYGKIVSARVNKALHDRIRRAAKAADMSVARYVLRLLETAHPKPVSKDGEADEK